VKHSLATLLALSTVATTTVAHGAPPELVVFVQATKKGDVMLAVGVLAAAAALVLGLRFSVVTLVLLTLATVVNFATSVLGGSGPLVVGLQMLATLASLQISYLVGCLLTAHLPVRAELPLRPHANALRCIQATHFRKD
jgi:hypothetical protein